MFDSQTYLRCEECGEFIVEGEAEAHERSCVPRPSKKYAVTIEATITKTFLVDAPSEEEAVTEAEELFNPHSGEAEEKYRQETVCVMEVE